VLRAFAGVPACAAFHRSCVLLFDASPVSPRLDDPVGAGKPADAAQPQSTVQQTFTQAFSILPSGGN